MKLLYVVFGIVFLPQPALSELVGFQDSRGIKVIVRFIEDQVDAVAVEIPFVTTAFPIQFSGGRKSPGPGHRIKHDSGLHVSIGPRHHKASGAIAGEWGNLKRFDIPEDSFPRYLEALNRTPGRFTVGEVFHNRLTGTIATVRVYNSSRTDFETHYLHIPDPQAEQPQAYFISLPQADVFEFDDLQWFFRVIQEKSQHGGYDRYLKMRNGSKNLERDLPAQSGPESLRIQFLLENGILQPGTPSALPPPRIPEPRANATPVPKTAILEGAVVFARDLPGSASESIYAIVHPRSASFWLGEAGRLKRYQIKNLRAQSDIWKTMQVQQSNEGFVDYRFTMTRGSPNLLGPKLEPASATGRVQYHPFLTDPSAGLLSELVDVESDEWRKLLLPGECASELSKQG